MRPKKIIGLAVANLALGFNLYGFQVGPDQVEISHVYIENSALAKVLEHKVLVHISDLHIDNLGAQEEKVLEVLNHLKPDLIFLTGDYVRWNSDYEPALSFLAKLIARVRILAVMGDYDYSNSRKSCLFCHEPGTGNPTKRHQVKFLRNGIEKGELDGEAFWIGGIDGEGDRDPAIRETVTGWKEKKPTRGRTCGPLVACSTRWRRGDARSRARARPA